MRVEELVMLARIMGQRYGIDVTLASEADTAFARQDRQGDVWKYRITIPCVKDKGKFDKMVRGYLDHEVGHVLFTDFDIVKSGLRERSLQAVFNIIEDVRIEELMGKLYPGSGANMRWLARHIFTPEHAHDSIRAFVNKIANGGADDEMQYFFTAYVLYKRRCWADAKLAHSDKLFEDIKAVMCKDDSFMAGKFKQLDELLEKPVRSTQESLELAERIFNLALRETEMQRPCNPGDANIHDDGFGNTRQFNKTDKRSWLALDDALSKHSREHDLQSGGAADQRFRCYLPPTDMDEAFRIQLSSGGQLDDSMRATRTEAIGAALYEEKRLPDRAMSPGFVRTPQYHWLRSALGCMLPSLMQSMQYKPCRTGYTGRLNARRLFKVGVGDGRVFHHKAERQEQAVDVALLLDVSGSMSARIRGVETVFYAMLSTLVTLPKVRVYAAAYSSQYYTVINRFADKRVLEQRLVAGGNTPTAGAMLRALSVFNTNSSTRRMMFVITDGEPDNYDGFRASLRLARRFDVETYGISLGYNNSKMRDSFGDEYFVYAEDTQAFPGELTDIMRKALIRAVA